MLYFSKFLLILIHINPESILNWCDTKFLYLSILNNDIGFIEILPLNFLELWKRAQEGLTLDDIENLLFFIIFLRFSILTIRYNLKTSFYIMCIGIFAGYLWYRHLIDLIAMYKSILINLPYLSKLGIDASQFRSISQQKALTNLNLESTVKWYNPTELIYYSVLKGVINTDLKTGLRYYIDPLSMFISNLEQSQKESILPIYYEIYHKFIPQTVRAINKFWIQLSGIASYAIITRIGKRYCPYLIRWHWTFILIIGFIEQILIYFCYRISYFQSNILIPRFQLTSNYIDSSSIFQIDFLNNLLIFLIYFHIGFILFGLFHAILGQYFYFPFLVENTELHIGPRPVNSRYSGGYTAWQNNEEQNPNSVFPKLWYGWFGRGTKNKWNFFISLKNLFTNLIRKFFSRI